MTDWHLSATMAERYSHGQLTPVLAASVEQHLIGCETCRAMFSLERGRRDAIWAEVLEQVHAPRSGLLRRLLLRAGVSEATARVVSAAPLLRGAWLTSVTLVLALALYAAHATPRGLVAFLVLAPVLPLIGVIAAFGPGADPTHEMLAASPYSMIRMLALRSTLIVATTLVPATLFALLLPGDQRVAVAWLLPSLAMTSVSLALAGHVPVHVSAAMLGGLWVGICTSRVVAVGVATTVEQQQAVQITSVVVLTIAAWSITTGRQELSEQIRRHL